MTFSLFTFLYPIPYTLNPSYAAEEFATSYDVTYEVGLDGVTTVTEKISLRNLTSQYYATQFSLTIGATQISDVSASDQSGPLQVKQESKGTSTTLGVQFNQQVAGQGKILPWTLTFKSKDFAQKIGKIWEVSAPKIVSSGSLENYNLTMLVPTSFGAPTQISPTPVKQTLTGDKLALSFNKDQLMQFGVSASFGENQIFDFDLSYHLENPNLRPVLTSIALPPDTAYQDLIFQRIEPQPINITIDADGNYLAWYRLARNQKIDIKVLGSAKLYTRSKVKNPTLEPALRAKYTASDKYWDSDNPAIQAKVREILTGSENKPTFEKAKLIHLYVSNNLKYDSSRLSGGPIDRLGAITALTNPQSAVCMEFTDLFIALARAAGIPARELDGYAYTNNSALRPLSLNQDILHAWPEFFDETRGWVMIDPTWESTTGGVDYFNKLDLSHFVFVTKGLSSQDPASAGSYKFVGTESKDVNVTLGEKDFLGKSQLSINVEAPAPVLAGLPSKIKVKITNSGNSLQQSVPFSVAAGSLSLLDPLPTQTGPIPAFGYAEFEINVRTKSLVENYDDVVEVSVAGQKFRKDVQVRPLVIFQGFPYVLFGVGGSMVLVYLGILSTFIYRRRLAKRSK